MSRVEGRSLARGRVAGVFLSVRRFLLHGTFYRVDSSHGRGSIGLVPADQQRHTNFCGQKGIAYPHARPM